MVKYSFINMDTFKLSLNLSLTFIFLIEDEAKAKIKIKQKDQMVPTFSCQWFGWYGMLTVCQQMFYRKVFPEYFFSNIIIGLRIRKNMKNVKKFNKWDIFKQIVVLGNNVDVKNDKKPYVACLLSRDYKICISPCQSNTKKRTPFNDLSLSAYLQR